MTLTERLKAARAALGLSQKQIAAQSGVSARGYQGYEDGRSVPGGEAIEGFVRLGINSNWLLTGEGPMLLRDLVSAEQPAAAIDLRILQATIEAVEQFLMEEGLKASPERKARLIVAVYRYAEAKGLGELREFLKLVA